MSHKNGPDELPYLSTQQMIEVDRAMVEDFGIDLMQMMENAGRNLAHLARQRFLGGNTMGKPVVILAGSGGNGGGALVAARHLHNWGTSVQVILGQAAAQMTAVSSHQRDILSRMHVPILSAQDVNTIENADLLIDGLIGYRLHGTPRDTVADLIEWANGFSAPILALDTPSGIDTTTGTIFNPAIQATATMTLALPKEGLRGTDAQAQVGELYLADISVPPGLYHRPPLNLSITSPFHTEDIIRLR